MCVGITRGSAMQTIKLVGYVLLCWLGLYARCGMAADLQVKVVRLHLHTAEQVIPLIKPLLVAEGVVTGSQNTLIIKTTRQNLTQVQNVLDELERPPQALLISLSYGYPPADDGQQVITTSAKQQQPESIQQLRTLDGEEGFVGTTREVRIVDRMGVMNLSANSMATPAEKIDASSSPTSSLSAAQVEMSHKKLRTGFYVKPLLMADEHVKLILRQQAQQLSRDNSQATNGSDMQTTLVIPLNQWVSLRGTRDVGTAVTWSTKSKDITRGDLFIKVETVD